MITATATDAAGNMSVPSGSLSLVVDQTAPEITLTGGEVTVAHAGTYTDPGMTAQDEVDGTMSVEVSHAVDTATVGVHGELLGDRQCGQHRDRESNGE